MVSLSLFCSNGDGIRYSLFSRQVRLDMETLNLTKRRANFERDREGLTVAEEEEYERESEKANFRIRILQQRQNYHEKKSLSKYLDMESKLRNDSRFSRLYEV